MKIAYIIGTFPCLTTTFIEREILEASNQGLDLVLVSIRPVEQFIMSHDVESLVARTRYIFPVHWSRLLGAHFRFALTRFGTYTCTLLYLLTRPHANLQARFKTFFHFVEGVYAADLLRDENVDMVHAHFADRAATVALVAARLLKLPYSFTAHARNIYVNPTLLPEKIAEAQFVTTCTAYNKAHLERVAGAQAADKIHLIYHGLDLADFTPNDKLVTETPHLLAVGRLQEKKGFSYLVKACHLLKQQNHHFICEIVGGGPKQVALQELIASLGVEDVVTLRGELPFSEVLARYRQADVFTLPCIVAADGDRDGIPNVLLEAMAMQLPVVSTTLSGIPELVEDGINGLLVPPGDERALAAALARLLTDANLRMRLGKHGREKVARMFDLSRNVGQLIALFEDVLQRDRAPGLPALLPGRMSFGTTRRGGIDMPGEQPTEVTASRKNSLSYVIITPVRNEAAFIEKTLHSVAAQTVRPAEWIIVNDGSTDETGDIVARYAEHYSWIKLINRQDRGYRQRGPGVVDAFYKGFSQIAHTDYDVVVKLDGDLSFEPNYFEELLNQFAANPRLGIASGQPYVLEGKEWTTEKPLIPCTYGPTKLYRRECFEAIGGIPRSLGWDGIDDWRARMLGWQIVTFENLKVLHHRTWGAATGALKSRVEQGQGAYFMGYHPLFMLVRGVRRMADKPYVIGGLMMLWGYVTSWLTRKEQVEPELVCFLRRTQLRVLASLVWPRSSTRSLHSAGGSG